MIYRGCRGPCISFLIATIINQNNIIAHIINQNKDFCIAGALTAGAWSQQPLQCNSIPFEKIETGS